ncbi:MAG: hypothetical protein HYZ54_05790 [Ignavibacteriae bacterium]|nr:hypothetical protein [Ignavibacteriota bacterium]
MINKTYTFFALTFVFLQCLTAANSKEYWEQTGTFDGANSGLIQSIGVASNGHLFACVNNGAPTYRSTDNGVSWQKSSLPSNEYITSFVTKDSMMFAASSSGVFRSLNNGQTWSIQKTGLTDLNIKDLIILENGTLVAGTHNGGIFHSTDSALTWSASNEGLSSLSINSLATLNNNLLIAGTDGGGIFISSDGGTSWKISSNEVQLNYVHSFAINYHGYIYAGTDKFGIFRSKDTCVTWEAVANDISNSINAFVISAQNTIYAGTSQQGVYSSTDEGNSWYPDNDGFDINHLSVYSMVITPNGDIFAGTNGGAAYKKTIIIGIDDRDFNAGTALNNIIPSNEGFHISFQIERSSTVKCVLYSILGEKVADVINGYFDSGSHTMYISKSAISRLSSISGMYYCRFETPYYYYTKAFYHEH